MVLISPPQEELDMKTGLTLVELATEVERRANAKKDYVVSTENLRMESTARSSATAIARSKTKNWRKPFCRRFWTWALKSCRPRSPTSAST
jgi:hypothetical protein